MFEIPGLAELNLGVTLPAVTLSIGVCFLVLIDVFLPKERRGLTPWLALAGIAISFVLTIFQFNTGDQVALGGMFVADNFSAFLNLVLLVAAFIAILLAMDYNRRQDIERGEFYTLLLLATAGAMFMAHANDLIIIFVALELLSIPLYILAAFRPGNARSEESGMKYFILGAFASAFLLFGAALIYGATGTTSLPAIFERVAFITSSDSTSIFYLLVGAALMIVGLGFKVAVVPFHMWTPDVYEGAPTPVTAFMSVAAKIGGFAALLRVLVVGLPLLQVNPEASAIWQDSLWVISALTLLVGNVAAIAQNNIKRMLAYSSIANAGYILMAAAAAGTPGMALASTQSALIYVLAYMLTTLGAFAVVIAVEKADGTGVNLEDFIGLSKRRPLLAVAMAIFMLSLTGIPLTAGFIGKWFVFQVTLQAGLIPLAIIGVVTSVASAFYYVRVIVNMYLLDGDGREIDGDTQYTNWITYATLAGTLLLGIFPVLITNLTDTVALATAALP